ncbi:MAG: hypothetical protein K8F52_12945 [Candidatus Scalindua rubra]|uniref:Uncharacterized protein n=1 Tax=Candidatus Scalindua brodae TaxID=237368 RepID=A0A0B0EEZ7_9BACT|nr:MAG: hypothetical protein SCABRO_02576 [Candidatus Scalindua brodae]MBZ0109567.1 hypothetical protein [Candidatus Scalindua rubra]TWU28851.1 hypothetical protein S225a_27450 [Candidatus Brocadiaceae bacterium S225]
MGDLFKKLDEIMTGDLVRKVGGVVCLVAVILVGAAFIVGAKSVLNTMKGPAVAVEATDEDADDEATSEEEEEEEDYYEDEDDYDE